jgi:hypothetical protein
MDFGPEHRRIPHANPAFDACMARLQARMAHFDAARKTVGDRVAAAHQAREKVVLEARISLELRIGSVRSVRPVVQVDWGAQRPGKKKRGPDGETTPALPRPKPLPLLGGAEAPLD